jgi:L-ascorbate metabolism protein UlaG (beta-lactamase superfamily)
MIITYQGAESFKISQGDLSVAINPISRDSKFKSRNSGADITLITTNHVDMNGADQTSRGDKESFVISGPGEYEVKDVSIKGFLSESKYGLPAQAGAKEGEKKFNTIYQIGFEGMDLCFLGALSNPELSKEAVENMEEIDILFVPLAEGTLDPASAYKLAVSLEPSIIIPMHYTSETLKKFIKEAGEDSVSPVDKLVVKKKDLEGKEGEIVVIKEE